MTEPDPTQRPAIPSEDPAGAVTSAAPAVRSGMFLLELVPVPVSDVDRAKAYYSEQLGFHVDVDVRPAGGVRIVQLTPPGSACSITLTTGIPWLDMPAGSLRGLHLVVSDIEEARAALIGRGAEVGPGRGPRRRLLRLIRRPRQQHLDAPAHALAQLAGERDNPRPAGERRDRPAAEHQRLGG
jgi:catechol 2,3-dioxygenase-like lactoylglutathione lyase family enzyme